MRDPFLIEGPALISFSGGRTSAYMLRRILDAGLQSDVHIVFANTGKECHETLEFVRECSERWSVNVQWVEWVNAKPCFREVDYATASRDGEPFRELVHKKKMLPNPVMRLCTQHLKIEVMKQFAIRELKLEEWTSVIGIRADEPKRWRILGRDSRNRREFKIAPLKDAGIGLPEIMDFWRGQPFDLGITSEEGNCDLCFLKGAGKLLRLLVKHPEKADWWDEQERGMAATFRARRTYAQLRQLAVLHSTAPVLECSVPAGADGLTRKGRLELHPLLFLTEPVEDDLDDLGDCFCGD